MSLFITELEVMISIRLTVGLLDPLVNTLLALPHQVLILWEYQNHIRLCVTNSDMVNLAVHDAVTVYWKYNLELNPTMIERDDDSAEFWTPFDTNYQKLNDGCKKKLQIRKFND